jgi:ubiquinone/menaquinone biosynthesis C-methylase UbiE
VEHVRQKVEQVDAGNVDVLLANAADTELPDASFDLAFVFGLGRVVGDMQAIWAELHRLLKPEGILSVEGQLRPPSGLFHPLERNGRIVQFGKTQRVQ